MSAERDPRTDRIEAHVLAHPDKEFDAQALADALDISRGFVSRALPRLVRGEDAAIERVEHGVYRAKERPVAPEVAERSGRSHEFSEEFLFEGDSAGLHRGMTFEALLDRPDGRVLLVDAHGSLWLAQPADVVVGQ